MEQNREILRVSDAMDLNPWTISSDTRLDDAALQLFQKRLESCVVLEKNGHIRGGLELRDLWSAQVDGKKRKTIGEVLQQPALIISPEADLLQALEEMKKRKLSQALVIDDKKLVGELRLSSIGARLPTILASKEKELGELRFDGDRKDEYLGLVSHDMRAPLTVISLSTDFLLADESVRTLSHDQKSFVERIKRNGEMASSMIHDILDVVRLEHGFRLDYQIVRFADLLNETIQNLGVVAGKKNVTIQVAHDHDILVNLDAKRMRQVFENLLINAIKFSPPNGQVFVHSWLVEKNQASFVAFQVRDQGLGIRKEDEAKVFEAFVQSGRNKQGVEGVGLGLAIVRKFVEFHQGTIELDGGWQKGASITLYLPNASLAKANPEASVAPNGPVVLLVEDDESIREFYKQSLDDYNYHVLEAGDGAEGFSLFQQHKVDLVLSDIRMPNVDGLELLTKIRMTGSKVPIILCSGYYVGLENDLTKSDHKPNRIIDKPFKVKDMVDAIEDQLRRFKQAS